MRVRLTIVITALVLSGCALPGPAVVPDDPRPAAQPEPPPEVQPEPVAAPPPPQPPPAPPPAPEAFAPVVAIVQSSSAGAYSNVAAALAAMVENAEVYDLSDRSLSPRDAFTAIETSSAVAVVAIGLRAAVYARDYAKVPVIFSQVFNVSDNDLLGENVRGVSALPPLDKQLAAWKPLAPEMQSVGAIIGSGHELLLDEAGRAAAANGLEFHSRVAGSDREALYLFTRMVPQIDGFWLFPDNRILSSAVLRDMLEYAARHKVQVAVFNDSLLEIGASVSATADEQDIANTVVDILRQLHDGSFASVPPHSALQDVQIRVNEKLRRRMRLATGQATGGSP